jgi:hypothetical protein
MVAGALLVLDSHRRTTGEWHKIIGAMPPDELMTAKQAEDYKRQLSMLSEAHVLNAYREALANCSLYHGNVPTPAEIQRLLCSWKVLWSWRKNKR